MAFIDGVDATYVKAVDGQYVCLVLAYPQDVYAHLIAAACNACIEINPDNPQAAAEALVDLYEVCAAYNEVFDEDLCKKLEAIMGEKFMVWLNGILNSGKQAKTKAEGKE